MKVTAKRGDMTLVFERAGADECIVLAHALNTELGAVWAMGRKGGPVIVEVEIGIGPEHSTSDAVAIAKKAFNT